MPAALLDTNAVSDLVRGQAQVKNKVSTHLDPVLTSVVVAGEIRYGLSRLPQGKKRTDLEARAQVVLSTLHIEPISQLIAEEYGNLKAMLEAQGLSLFDNDIWIAASALVQGCLLVTRDQIFLKIPGLQVEDWTQ